MLLLLGASLRRGHSGVRPELVELLHALLERDVVPVVPSKGSVGSSGDLAPLAHLALVLIGEGEATVGGERLPGAEALAQRRAAAARAEREGGARADQRHAPDGGRGRARRARGGAAGRRGDRRRGALARGVQGLDGAVRRAAARAAPAARASRPSPRACARCWRTARSSPATPTAAACRTPTRCAARRRCSARSSDAVAYVAGAIERELEAVTDNPLVFPGGRAATCSRAATSTASRCRCRSTTWRSRCASWRPSPSAASTRCSRPAYAELPPFLSPRPGLSSGLMIAQYAAAALVNECQVLVASGRRRLDPDERRPGGLQLDGRAGGAEGAHGGRERRARDRDRARLRVQGLEFHRPLRTTAALEAAVARVRAYVPRVEEDRSLAGELAALAGALRTGELTCEWRCSDDALPRLAAGGRAADAREQPPSRRGREAGGARRLRRHRQGGAQPGVPRGDQARADRARRRARRCSCSRASRSRCSRRTRRRRAC